MANYLVITIILLILLISIPIYQFVIKKAWRKKRIWNHIKDLYEIYDKGCQDITVQKWETTESALSAHSWINGVYLRNGFCCALGDMVGDYYIRKAVINIIASHVTLSDLDWKMVHKSNSEVILQSIHNGEAEGMYWFLPGDVVSRRDFLHRVLILNGKMK